MRKNIIFLLCFFLASCADPKTLIREGWILESKITYTQNGENIQKSIGKVIAKFDKAILYDKSNWNSGYSQKNEFYRKLYFMQCISKNVLLNALRINYENWFSYNPDGKNHLIPYAFTILLCDEKEKAEELLRCYYSEDHQYNMNNPTVDDFFNFIAGSYLGVINNDIFIGSVYENFMNMSEADLINSVIGY